MTTLINRHSQSSFHISQGNLSRKWIAWHEETILGYFDTREEAEKCVERVSKEIDKEGLK